ncbi:small ubiquitin-related protein [Babesia caballi]|uniref:Small ubiquitin-related protein n=1 Tax=Babesia caballi TaxID=5871 RepID=A0AAV4M392_BABCB|nr:small ubiquitin-related protein [Babesia caballi]
MASTWRSEAGGVWPAPGTHSAYPEASADSPAAGESAGDDEYGAVSKVIALYGIEGEGLEESYRRNKTEFAAAVVERFHRRDQRKSVILSEESSPMVDIRQFSRCRGDQHRPEQAQPGEEACFSQNLEQPAQEKDTSPIFDSPTRDTEFVRSDVIDLPEEQLTGSVVTPFTDSGRITPPSEPACFSETVPTAHFATVSLGGSCTAVAEDDIYFASVFESGDGRGPKGAVGPSHVGISVTTEPGTERFTEAVSNLQDSVEMACGSIELPHDAAVSEGEHVSDTENISRDSPPGEAERVLEDVFTVASTATEALFSDVSGPVERGGTDRSPMEGGDTTNCEGPEVEQKSCSLDDTVVTECTSSALVVRNVFSGASPVNDSKQVPCCMDPVSTTNSNSQTRKSEALSDISTHDNGIASINEYPSLSAEGSVDLWQGGAAFNDQEVAIATTATNATSAVEEVLITEADVMSGKDTKRDGDGSEECGQQVGRDEAETTALHEPIVRRSPKGCDVAGDMNVDGLQEATDPEVPHGSDGEDNVVTQRLSTANADSDGGTGVSRFDSVRSSMAESPTFHDVLSARPADDNIVLDMVLRPDAFSDNQHRLADILRDLPPSQLEQARNDVEQVMRSVAESGDPGDGHVAFVLLLFLEMHSRDPIMVSLFVQLTTRVLASLPDQPSHCSSVYRLFLEALVPVTSKELPFEVARALMDACVGAAFKLNGQNSPLGGNLRALLCAVANRCTTLDEYHALVHMVATRVETGARQSGLITALLLRVFELMLSSAHMKNPLRDCRSAVRILVDASLAENFDFLKALVESFATARYDVAAHFCVLFVAQMMMERVHEPKTSVLHKRRCLRVLQVIASPVFAVLNDVEGACGFVGEYVACFKSASAATMKLAVFDLNLLEGCGNVEAPSEHRAFDAQALVEAARRYMSHLGVSALQGGKLCDLVLLLSLKHVACSHAEGGVARLTSDKRLRDRRLGDSCCATNGVIARKKARAGHGAAWDREDCGSGSSADSVDTASPVDEAGDTWNPWEVAEEPACPTLEDEDEAGARETFDGEPQEDRVVRYARIVSRLFRATRGQRLDGALEPQLGQYLLLPARKLAQLEGAEEAATCFKIVLYHLYNDLFLGIWRTMTHVLYTTNEYSQLSSASAFVYEAVTQRAEYLRYRVVRRLLVACLGDQCYMVRLTAARLMSELFSRPVRAEECCGEQLLDKVVLSMRDVNWKVRLAATTAVFHYVRRKGVDMGVMSAVAAVAERACDLEREQPPVRDAVLNALAYSLFATAHPFMTAAACGEDRVVPLADRFVKVILYKMSAFKARENHVERVLQHYKGHFAQVEGESAALRALSKQELREAAESHARTVLERWMSLLLELFLLRRSEGASFHVLAEVLCVLKLFGQVNPGLFASHLTYFLPYLRCDAAESVDASRVDVVVLVCNLVAIASGHSRDLEQVDHHVVKLVSYDAPALTRAAIQLLVALGSLHHVAAIFEESFEYLAKLRAVVTAGRSSPEEIVRVMSYNVLLRSAWKLGCVTEFADLSVVLAAGADRAQRLFDLLLDLAEVFYAARLYNVAGMLVQSVARMFINLRNVLCVDFKGVRRVRRMFGEEPMVACVMMVLYQLLATYARLAAPSGPDAPEAPAERLRAAHNEVFRCLGGFVEAFVGLVTVGEDLSRPAELAAGVDPVMAIEICNMILVNRLTNPESLAPFLFCHVVSQEPNTQRLAEQALKTLARNDPEIFLARLGTCWQALFLGRVVDSFTASLTASTEGRAKGAIPGTVEPASLKEHCPEFILGYESEFTTARVRGIVRLFLEAVTAPKHAKKLMVVLVAQLSACLSQDFREAIAGAAARRAVPPEAVQGIRSNSGGRLPRLLMKHLSRARKGDPAGLVDYFALLFVDLLATVLDHLAFRDAGVARFLLKRVGEAVKAGCGAGPEDVRRYRDSRLIALSARIKQFYA